MGTAFVLPSGDVFVDRGVIFEDFDLSRTTLEGTVVRRIRFRGVRWQRRRSRNVVYDELKPTPPDPETLRLLYRDLKSSLEDDRDYGNASDFYYGEMEIARKQRRPDELLFITLIRNPPR